MDEQRLERIESKLSFAEDLLDELNHTIFRQQEQISRLQTQVRLLAERSDSASAGASRDLRDEIPPHY